jgi:hypothetical protein
LGKSFLAGGNLMLWWIAPTLTQSKAHIWEEARKTLAQGSANEVDFEYEKCNQASIHLQPGNNAAAVAQSERMEDPHEAIAESRPSVPQPAPPPEPPVVPRNGPMALTENEQKLTKSLAELMLQVLGR